MISRARGDRDILRAAAAPCYGVLADRVWTGHDQARPGSRGAADAVPGGAWVAPKAARGDGSAVEALLIGRFRHSVTGLGVVNSAR